MYYKSNNILSYNRFLNMVVGTRGIGKTYFGKTYCINDYINKGNQFIWIRRKKSEILELREKFTTDILKLYPNKEFKCTSKYIYMRESSEEEENKNKWYIIGYFISLSTALGLKSNSYANVKTIVYDEFITSELYLDDEVNKFLELLETIIRLRDNCKVFMFANAISIDNPYFNEWGIKSIQSKFQKTDVYVLENCDADEEYKETKNATPLGKLMKKSKDYYNYNLNNQFLLDDYTNIISMPKGENRFICNLILNNKEIGFYLINCLLYFGKPTENGTRYTIYVDDAMKNNSILVDKKFNLMKYIAKAYSLNKCFYYDIKIKNEIILLCRYLLRNY